MVSQAVIIGATSAAATFVLLCVGSLAYYCCCYKKGRRIERKMKVADRPLNGIDPSKTRPPKMGLQTRAVNEIDDTGGTPFVYPPLQHSIDLPAVTMPISEGKTTRGGRKNRLVRTKPTRTPSAEEAEEQRDTFPTGPAQISPRKSRASSGSLSDQALKRKSVPDYDPLTGGSDRQSTDKSILQRSVSVFIDNISGEKVAEAPNGQIQFKLEYIYATSSLRVHLFKAIDLPAMDAGGTSDPFAQVFLVDTREVAATGKVLRTKASWKTKPHMKTLNPEFDVFHDMPCPSDGADLNRLGLLMYIYDYDRVTKNTLIGHVWLMLRDVDISGIPTLWKAIQKGKKLGAPEEFVPLGDLKVALGFSRESRKLTVVVRSAENLPKTSLSKPPIPFIKIKLIYDHCKIGKKTFPPTGSDVDPTFNKTVHFTLDASVPLEQCALTVAIWHHERMNSTALGLVNFSSLEVGDEQLHWKEMLEKDGQLVEKWHSLRPLADAAPYDKKKRRSRSDS